MVVVCQPSVIRGSIQWEFIGSIRERSFGASPVLCWSRSLRRYWRRLGALDGRSMKKTDRKRSKTCLPPSDRVSGLRSHRYSPTLSRRAFFVAFASDRSRRLYFNSSFSRIKRRRLIVSFEGRQRFISHESGDQTRLGKRLENNLHNDGKGRREEHSHRTKQPPKENQRY